MEPWRKYLLVGAGVFVVLTWGFLQTVQILETGSVWPALRETLLFLSVAAAVGLVILFYKVRRLGPTLLSTAGVAALLAGIWWGIPAERDFVANSAENLIELAMWCAVGWVVLYVGTDVGIFSSDWREDSSPAG